MDAEEQRSRDAGRGTIATTVAHHVNQVVLWIDDHAHLLDWTDVDQRSLAATLQDIARQRAFEQIEVHPIEDDEHDEHDSHSEALAEMLDDLGMERPRWLQAALEVLAGGSERDRIRISVTQHVSHVYRWLRTHEHIIDCTADQMDDLRAALDEQDRHRAYKRIYAYPIDDCDYWDYHYDQREELLYHQSLAQMLDDLGMPQPEWLTEAIATLQQAV